MGTDEPGRRMTTDHERIREWAEARDAVPVSTHGGEGHGHSFARRDEIGTDQEERGWDEFRETFADQELVFVYDDRSPDEGLGSFDLLEREAAFDRAELGRSDLEDRLRSGERVTTEIVETQVIEREVVERDTLESEVVDAERLERHVLDTELLDRDVVDLEFVSADVIEVTTDEHRLETVEEIERYTVETRVVDVDLEHDESLARDEIETDVDLDTVQRTLLEGDLVRSDVDVEDIVEQEVIESKRGEGETVRSDLIERRTIEEEIDERTRMRFTLEDTDLVRSEVVGHEFLEGDIIDREEYESMERDAERSPAAEPGARDDAGMEAEPGAGMAAEPGMEAEPGTDATAEPGMEADSGPGTTAEPEAEAGPEAEHEPATADAGAGDPTRISADDQGKDVLDESGDRIGIVSAVEEGTAYVDPEPGLTDRLRARLNWGQHSGDEYPVEQSQIADVTDDEIVLRSE